MFVAALLIRRLNSLLHLNMPVGVHDYSQVMIADKLFFGESAVRE